MKGKKKGDTKKKKSKEKELAKVEVKPHPGMSPKILETLPAMIDATIDGHELTGGKKQFSSGSTGWNITGKVMIHGVRCQVNANVTVIGSKPQTR